MAEKISAYQRNKLATKSQEGTPKTWDELILQYGNIARKLELGEYTEEIEKELETTIEDFADKLAGIKFIIGRNEGIIKDFMKNEIQRLTMKSKSMTKSNDFLKERAMYIVEMFGVNDKLVTDRASCSIVRKASLVISESEFQERIEYLVECIKFNAIYTDAEDGEVDVVNDDEISYLDVNFSLPKMNLEIAAKVYQAIKNVPEFVERENEINISITPRNAEILEQLVAIKTRNAGIEASHKDYVESVAKAGGDVEALVKPELYEFGIKGVSVGETTYPRFS